MRLKPSFFTFQKFPDLIFTEGEKKLLSGIRAIQHGNVDIVFPLQFRIGVDFHRCLPNPHALQHNGYLITQMTPDQRIQHQFLIVVIADGHAQSNALCQIYSGTVKEEYQQSRLHHTTSIQWVRSSGIAAILVRD
jgi:hypothetical protein